MKYTFFRDVRCVVRLKVEAEDLEEATEHIWNSVIRPSKWTCDNENVEVYDLPPVDIDSWADDCKMISSDTADIGFFGTFTLAYKFEASSDEEAKKIVDECKPALEDWEYSYSDEEPHARTILLLGDITGVKKE